MNTLVLPACLCFFLTCVLALYFLLGARRQHRELRLICVYIAFDGTCDMINSQIHVAAGCCLLFAAPGCPSVFTCCFLCGIGATGCRALIFSHHVTIDRQVVLGGDGGVRDGAASARAAVRDGYERRAQPRVCGASGRDDVIDQFSRCPSLLVLARAMCCRRCRVVVPCFCCRCWCCGACCGAAALGCCGAPAKRNAREGQRRCLTPRYTCLVLVQSFGTVTALDPRSTRALERTYHSSRGARVRACARGCSPVTSLLLHQVALSRFPLWFVM